jgi:hypothetical protein
VNRRAEFFNTTIDEIESMVKGLNLNIQLTKIAEAKEYRETLALRETLNNAVHKSDKAIEGDAKFPASLND